MCGLFELSVTSPPPWNPPGEFDFGHREQARHEEVLAEFHFIHLDVEHGVQSSPQGDGPHRGLLPGEFLEACAHRVDSSVISSGTLSVIGWRRRCPRPS